mmetsp:Transcript_11698/g.25670  ORF Transcript_11698/g.25670 Transcript_11698/m.25670 type:complete len:91 (-) Transcript_11698:1280-1552(-)
MYLDWAIRYCIKFRFRINHPLPRVFHFYFVTDFLCMGFGLIVGVMKCFICGDFLRSIRGSERIAKSELRGSFGISSCFIVDECSITLFKA